MYGSLVDGTVYWVDQQGVVTERSDTGTTLGTYHESDNLYYRLSRNEDGALSLSQHSSSNADRTVVLSEAITTDVTASPHAFESSVVLLHKDESSSFYQLLHLRSATLGPKVLVPPNSHAAVLLPGGRVVVARPQHLDVYERGVWKQSLPVETTKGPHYQLLAHGKRIAVVSNDERSCCVATTVLKLDRSSVPWLQSSVVMRKRSLEEDTATTSLLSDAITHFATACTKRRDQLASEYRLAVCMLTADTPTKRRRKNGVHTGKNAVKPEGNLPVVDDAAFVQGCLTPLCTLLLDATNTKNLGEAFAILRALVQSGHVLARPAFGRTLGECTLTVLLEKLFSLQKTKSSYTPLQLVVDVLEHCPDVSEHQMIAMLHYCMLHGEAHSLASLLPTASSPKKATSNGSRKRARTISTSKDVALGVGALLYKVLQYSSCNEALLRSAIQSTMSQDEVALLVRLVSASLNACLAKEHCSVELVHRHASWLGALVDSVRPPIENYTTSAFAGAQQVLRQRIKQCEALMSLQGILLSTIASEKTKSSTPSSRPKQLAPYQVERLVF